MEEVEDSTVNPSPSSPQEESLPFVEVICTASGKIRRFSFGTESGFAGALINEKLQKEGISEIPLATHIEAIKEGEEPVSFGPSSILVNYGLGWKLQTVNDIQGVVKVIQAGASSERADNKVKDDLHSKDKKSQAHSAICSLYTAKIFLAFVFILIFGAIFALALENLPYLILYINSYV